MQLSKHNIISKLKSSDNYFIVNPLSGNADIIGSTEAQTLLSGKMPTNTDEYLQKGYIVDAIEEARLYKAKYLDFLDERDADEVQIFFVPTYACNFNCTYCYQSEYTNPALKADNQIIDAFWRYIDKTFAGRKKYVTIFGGEPLLAGDNNQLLIQYFLQKSVEYHTDIAIVTNGYELMNYIDILKTASIREIQVTLDGIGSAHDVRRPLHSGSGTFEKVVAGIDASLQNHLPINLRMVIDKENMAQLPIVAKFAIDKAWTRNLLFKTQLGRNYELHFCQHDNNKLYSRIEMYEDIYRLIKQYPEILEFHKPAFSIAKFLFENGELPAPLFDACPATKTEWAFDYSGKIYSCTATVGKDQEALGTFYPDVTLYNELIDVWNSRDVLTIPECKDCNLQLACGGGCGSVAKNQTGNVHSPDCRPIKELLELGIDLYNKD